MDIYTNKEKSEVLNIIASSTTQNEPSCIDNKKYQTIIDEYLVPYGFVKVSDSSLGGYICSITDKGLNFLKKGGFEQLEIEQQLKRKSDELMQENIRLTNIKLKYEIKTRRLAVLSLVASIIGVIIAGLSLFLSIRQ